MFISILVHELSHVLMGQAFGAYGHIVLYGFGGLAVGSNQLNVRWQRVAKLPDAATSKPPLARGELAGRTFSLTRARCRLALQDDLDLIPNPSSPSR
jgi:hypothetical protein